MIKNTKALTVKAQVLAIMAVISVVALGVSSFVSSAEVFTEVKSLTGATIISAGQNSSQVITSDNTHLSRGLNNYGQLGLGNYENQREWTTGSAENIAKLSSPYTHTVALTKDGKIYTWGDNKYQQLGQNAQSSQSMPAPVSIAYKFKTVSTGQGFSLAIDKSGNLYSWGINNYGQLGTGDTNIVKIPEIVSTGTKFSSVKAGKNYGMALDNNGIIWSWGANDKGQLGNGNTEKQLTPKPISDKIWSFINTNSSSETSIAIDAGGKLFTWGANNNGQLGNGSDWRQQQTNENERVAKEIQNIKDADAQRKSALIATCEAKREAEKPSVVIPTPTPTPVPTEEPIPTPTEKPTEGGTEETPVVTPTPTPTPAPTKEPVAPVYDKTCTEEVNASFIATDTSNIKPSIIPEPTLSVNSVKPVPVTNGEGFSYAAVGAENGFAIDVNGILYGWGADKNGQTGIDINDEKSHTQVAIAVNSNSKFKQVDVGIGFAAAITVDDNLFTWGKNDAGSLGAGEDIRKVPALAKSKISFVALGQKTGVALGTDGTIFTWGHDTNNLLGGEERKSGPEIISTEAKGSLISVGSNSVIGLNQNGQLIAWGNNINNTFGNPEILNSAIPVSISPSQFIGVAAGKHFTMALDSNGQVWSWGLGSSGQTGENNDGEMTTNAIMVPLAGKIKLITAGEKSAYAVTEDNVILFWGNGNASAKQIKMPEGVIQITAGKNHVVVLDDNGHIWNWGLDTVALSGSAVEDEFNRVNTDDIFIAIAAGGETTIAIKENGNIVGWGDNTYRQILENGNPVLTPTVIDEDRKYKSISISETHVLAIDNNNVVYGWGSEPYGTFGDIATMQITPFVLPIINNKENGGG